MRIIDLTHSVSPDMPVYPGTEPPGFSEACTLDKDGFKEMVITLYSHTGTHMDSPAHLFDGGKTLDAYEPGRFCGPALVLDLSERTGTIEIEDLLQYKEKMQRVDFLLLHTGWGKLWGSEQYFTGFPVLSPEAARWLVQQGVKAIGVDAVSVDPVESMSALPVHQILLGCDVLIIENLTNLDLLVNREFTLCCLPLKIAWADGAPVRAMAIVNP